MRRLSLVLVLVAGCSSTTLSTGADLGVDDGATAPPPPNQVGGAPLPLSIGPFPLGAGEEFTRCVVVPLGNTTDIDAIQIDSTLAPGSHHLIIYKTSQTMAQPNPVDCHPFEGILTSQDEPIYIAETLANTLKLPAGVAYHFPAGQMVKIEAHYINATNNALMGRGDVKITPGTARSYLAADIMFCGSVGQLAHQCVPPATQRYTLDPGFYSGGGSVDLTQLKVFAFTSHEHRLGSEVTISKSTNKNDPGTMLYDNTSWDNPPLMVFDDQHLLSFGNNEGLRWQCSYDSLDAVPAPTGNTCFGESAATNEMCFIWAYYFPSVGHFISVECAQ
jgi:hypothetical protein